MSYFKGTVYTSDDEVKCIYEMQSVESLELQVLEEGEYIIIEEIG